MAMTKKRALYLYQLAQAAALIRAATTDDALEYDDHGLVPTEEDLMRAQTRQAFDVKRGRWVRCGR